MLHHCVAQFPQATILLLIDLRGEALVKQATDIGYVELATSEPVERAASFSLRHFVGATFRPGADDTPHRHSYQEIFVVQSGRGNHAIDGQSIDLLPSTVSLIGKGQVHLLDHLVDFTGWLIRFNDDFLPAGTISPSWNYHLTLFSQLGRAPTLALPPADLRDLDALLQQLEAEYAAPDAFAQESVLRHLLSVVLIRLERIYQNSFGTAPQEREAYRVYQQFMTLLDQHFAQHHDVAFYARTLHLAAARLSKILSRIVGKPTKQLIDERIVLEAKRYLHYTEHSIKEIAFGLGYSDLFHFSKLFKRVTGLSPQAFREQREKLT